MNISKPVFSSISGVDFGFLTEEEIKSISVKRIVNGTTFDSLLHPVPGGMYDTALGAFGDAACTTCKLNRFSCPGHCGHIELPVHVYHPNYMDQTLRLLNAQCIYCHRFRLSRVEANRFACKLRLLRHGLLNEAEQVDDLHLLGTFEKRYKAAGAPTLALAEESSSDSDNDRDTVIEKRHTFVQRAIKLAGREGRRADLSSEKVEAIGQARRTVIKEFLWKISQVRNCKSCQGISPKYRKDRFAKIFRKSLTDKEKAAMAQAGKRVESATAILAKRERAAQMAKKKHDKMPNGHVDEGIADMESPEPSSEDDGEDINGEDSESDGDSAVINASDVITATTTAKARKSKTAADTKQEFIHADEVHASLSLLFEQEAEVLGLVYGSRSKNGRLQRPSANMFFIKTLLVPPNRFRPEAKTGNDEIAEAPQNTLYKNIINDADTIRQIQEEILADGPDVLESGRQRRTIDHLQRDWIKLQDDVNALIDKSKSPVTGAAAKRVEDGIKQKLEKKEGLFRKHMMGKRVNFAARSVISPDPNIETNEIGVPPVFAKKLTYPEPVGSHNYYELHQAVVNGPDVWPGASAVENENGQVINLQHKTADERLGIANQLMAPSNTHVNGTRGKKVHRHLNNGDIVIMNRQPTLHKPSMMAHRARVLPAERTIRMHYANCNTYNADFDGDEMNMHFPQNEVARAEAVSIADTDHQYLSATAGKPLRGLIQDHISMGVQLTKRDTFFNEEEYHQLLYAALRPEHNHTASGRLEVIPPTIWKPKPLWTGKQVITTVLKNLIPVGHQPLNLTSKSSTSKAQWGDGSEEQDIHFREGYLLHGILDKAQVGPSKGGLVHAVYETYGHVVAGRLLSVLSRLLTKVLHIRAFSCGVEDLILTPKGNRDRLEKLKGAETLGLEVASKYVSLDQAPTKPQSTDPELLRRLEDVMRDDSKQATLDDLMKAGAAQLSSDITRACLPAGLDKPFPKNQMQAMTSSGAKGSQVNANLISCNLGQQVLEGRRVPTMVSGKTLPCFKPFESSLRAGGYISDRFLTGVRPQEYYFHAMAGREGLIDTAVKTSRSGYLQRCLVKGMEGLRVEYDTSVRDADGSMIQFLYGEDGLDVAKATYLNNFSFVANNFWSHFEGSGVRDQWKKVSDESEEIEEYTKNARKAVRKAEAKGEPVGGGDVPDPALSKWQPGRYGGSTSEKFYGDMRKYCDENPDKELNSKKKGISGKHPRKNFEVLMNHKYLKAIVEPGEAVGVVAAQSVGEPSTQMTLNTFHLAGHAAKNVTLGIPRLREIVMTASAHISTPTMALRTLSALPKEQAVSWAKGVSRLSIAEIVDKVEVTERIGKGVAYAAAKTFDVRLDLFPSDEYAKEYVITVRDVLKTLETKFIPMLHKMARDELKKKGSIKFLKTAAKDDALPEIGKSVGRSERQASVELDSEAEREAEARENERESDDDDDATNAKKKKNMTEGAGYDAMDDEDQEALKDQGVRVNEDEGDDDQDSGVDTRSRAGSTGSDNSDSENEESRLTQRNRKGFVPNIARQIESRIKESNSDIVRFKFDNVSGAWCTFSLEYDVSAAKVLMLNLVESCCRRAVIQAVPGLGQCTALTEKVPDTLNPGEDKEAVVVYTEGVNLLAMRVFDDVIDVDCIYTNSIHDMLRHYGVEAARATIIKEMHDVFSSHSISVDNRHLNLIADVMTRGGGFAPFNRMGMDSNTSPFMKMSFETTVGFLKDAVLHGERDDLKNPSARLVVGRLGRVGTGMVDVLLPVKKLVGASENRDESGDDENEDEDEGEDEDGDQAMGEAEDD
ncbi:beta and beta-prime subunits of DNA dependent RNA-polymerase [Rhizodiscina lignyota]|uniref:DNA-directed RNA polymerase subunit n=1 Tax=Rhizodiscina lignyota TaxID=1504668 RepID=A0A9P4M913_9PEZI|nr:beta and beta-prime subunits of DNA dependent RNA-polymerase [Rhizodiscina lignyota]